MFVQNGVKWLWQLCLRSYNDNMNKRKRLFFVKHNIRRPLYIYKKNFHGT